MSVVYQKYKADNILNIHKHVDGGWFWDKYSAYPYIGCQYGCEYCYYRNEKYLKNLKSTKKPATADPLSEIIKIKENAPELLDRALANQTPDTIMVGDYQPAEKEFRISRKMLEVCLKHSFPVEIQEKSPDVLDDTDIIKDISQKTWACVFFSIGFPVSKGYKEQIEPSSPAVEERFSAMQHLAKEGILTGTSIMPILPEINDNEACIEEIIAKTVENGGSFVIAGGLTLNGYTKEYFLNFLDKKYPDLVGHYKKLYSLTEKEGSEYWKGIYTKIKNLCLKYHIPDHMPRYIPNTELKINKKISRDFFLKAKELELSDTQSFRSWAYRKAAWTIDELNEGIDKIYKTKGLKGLSSLSFIGNKLARKIESLIFDELSIKKR